MGIAFVIPQATTADETTTSECPPLADFATQLDRQLKETCSLIGRASESGAPPAGTPFAIRFDSDLQGLQVGAPVRMRGFQIGTVSDVLVSFDSSKGAIETPVQINLVADRIVVDGDRPKDAEALRAAIDLMVQRGLRATIAGGLAGFGKPHVALKFVDDVPPAKLGDADGMPEIPAGHARSKRVEQLAENLLQKLESLPLETMAEDISVTMNSIRAVTESMPETLERLAVRVEAAIDAIEAVVAGADIKAIIEELRVSGGALRNAVESIEQEGVAVLEGFREAAATVGDAAQKAGDTVSSLEKSVGPKAVIWRDIDQLLEELTDTARAIRLLVAYLERHPEALLTGKPGE